MYENASHRRPAPRRIVIDVPARYPYFMGVLWRYVLGFAR